MAGMYPDNETLELFGEPVSYPGVDKDGKFTNGSFDDPLVRPSFIPAETINLILDNLSELLVSLGKTPDNKNSNQLASAITTALALKAPLASPTFTGTVAVPTKSGVIAAAASPTAAQGTAVATEGQLAATRNNINSDRAPLASPALTGTPTAPTAAANTNNTQIATTAFVNNAAHPVGSIYMSVNNTSPATLFGGTWSAWGAGRVPVGIDTSDSDFNTVEKTGGAKTHTLTTAQMPSHTHTQNAHQHENGFIIGNGSNISDVMSSTQGRIGVQNGMTFKNVARGAGATQDPKYIGSSGNLTMDSMAGWGLTDSLTPTNQNAGSGGSHNNLQPYIVCYMWKKTA